MGIESGRLHFSWISSAEAGKFVEVVEEITGRVRKLGPASKLIKEMPVVSGPNSGQQPVITGGH